jgi:YggT family protein
LPPPASLAPFRPIGALPAMGTGPSQIGGQLEASEPVLFLTLSQIVGYLISIIIVLVIVQFVLSLLIAFNVVNMHNQWVAAIWRAINALLEPILRPIRRLMPDTGAIDFSPLILIVLLNIVNIIFRNLAYSGLA